MGYQGKAHTGSAWIKMEHGKVKYWKDSGWTAMPVCNAYIDGAWRDILYHPPSIPPAGYEMTGVDSGRVYHYSTGNIGYYTTPGLAITAAGYDLAAVVASGKTATIQYRRSSSENTGTNFSMGLYNSGTFYGGSDLTAAGTNYRFTINAADLDKIFYIQWISASDSTGGGIGREFNSSGYTIWIN